MFGDFVDSFVLYLNENNNFITDPEKEILKNELVNDAFFNIITTDNCDIFLKDTGLNRSNYVKYKTSLNNCFEVYSKEKNYKKLFEMFVCIQKYEEWNNIAPINEFSFGKLSTYNMTHYNNTNIYFSGNRHTKNTLKSNKYIERVFDINDRHLFWKLLHDYNDMIDLCVNKNKYMMICCFFCERIEEFAINMFKQLCNLYTIFNDVAFLINKFYPFVPKMLFICDDILKWTSLINHLVANFMLDLYESKNNTKSSYYINTKMLNLSKYFDVNECNLLKINYINNLNYIDFMSCVIVITQLDVYLKEYEHLNKIDIIIIEKRIYDEILNKNANVINTKYKIIIY